MSTDKPTDEGNIPLILLGAFFGVLCTNVFLGPSVERALHSLPFEGLAIGGFLLFGSLAGVTAGFLVRWGIKQAKDTTAGWFLCFLVAFLSPVILAIGFTGIARVLER